MEIHTFKNHAVGDLWPSSSTIHGVETDALKELFHARLTVPAVDAGQECVVVDVKESHRPMCIRTNPYGKVLVVLVPCRAARPMRIHSDAQAGHKVGGTVLDGRRTAFL